MVKVSIIVPVYNVEKYLRECIDSVLRQTYTGLEIILVDDGSADSSGRICDEYAAKDSRITVIHKTNGGPSDARNTGIEIAGGKYIYSLDSDDYLAYDAIEYLVGIAEEKNPDIIFMDAVSFREEDYEGSYFEYLRKKEKYPDSSGDRMLLRVLENDEWMCGAPLHFYRADFIKGNRLRYVKGIYFEDLLFNGIAYTKARLICHCDKVLYYRRLRGDSIMTNGGSLFKIKCYRKCFAEFYKEYKNKPKGSAAKKALGKLLVFTAGVSCFNAVYVPDSEYKAVMEELKKIDKVMYAHRYFGDRRLRLKLGHADIYCRLKRNRFIIGSWEAVKKAVRRNK